MDTKHLLPILAKPVCTNEQKRDAYIQRERENLLDSIYANWMTHTDVHMYEHLGMELDV